MPMANPDYERLVARLAALRRRAVLLDLLTAAAWATLAGAATSIASLAMEAAAPLGPGWRALVLTAPAIAAVAVGAAVLSRRLPGSWSRHRLALRIEARCPQLRQTLVTVLELWPRDAAAAAHSPELLAAAASVARRALDDLTPATAVGSFAWRRRLAYPCLTLALLAGGLGLSADLAQALHRALHPLTAFAIPTRTQIAVSPGDTTVVRGADLTITARLHGDLPASLRVLHKEEGAVAWESDELVTQGRDTLRQVFRQIRRPFVYRLVAGDGSSGPWQVSVIDPPIVLRQSLRYHYPEYTGLPAREEADGGDIRALVGTRIEVRLEASKPLGQATLVRDDTLQTAAEVDGVHARAAFVVRTAGHYRMDVVDPQGLAGTDPITHTIEPVADEPPRLTLVEPGRDLDLPENMVVPLRYEATDDFGVAAVWLAWRVNDGPTQRARLGGGGRELALTHRWDLSTVELLPEDQVHYYLEADDNNAVNGPGQTRTPEYVLRFPSLSQLYEETAQERDEQVQNLQQLADESRADRQSLEKTRRELLRTEELSWEQRKELEANLAREAARAEAVDQLAQALGETLAKMDRNGLNSAALLDQVAELQRLMAEVLSPELRQALAQVQAALEQGDPTQLAAALQQFNEDQQAFQERLERTIALLEQVRLEQRLEAAVHQAEDLTRRQRQVNEGAARNDDSERLAEQEQALQQDTDKLQQELSQLGQSMQSTSPPTAQALAAEAARMASQDMAGRMGQMRQELQAEANTDARRRGEGLAQDLGTLSAALRQLQGEFTADQKRALSQQMELALRDLVDLSLEQEALLEETRQTPGMDAGRAARQYALMESAGKVAERTGGVGRRTLSLHPAALATIGHSLRRMQEAANALADPDAAPPWDAQAQAMAFLNEAAMQLRESLDNLAQSRSPSSFGEAMQKMLGLSEQQAQLNQATQQSLDLGMQGGRGQDTRARLDRLAAQQRRILEALQQLQRDTRGHRGAQQRLDAIEQDLEAATNALEQRRLDPRTTALQQRVLQRMLDASRSIHTQGEDERRRESTTGTDRAYAGPAWLPADLGQSVDQLRQALERALNAGYPEEYRAPIRGYFEGLFQDSSAPPEGAR